MEEKDKYIEAIGKLISLTRTGKLKWEAGTPDEIKGKKPEDFVNFVFKTFLKEKYLRIYEKKFREPKISLAAFYNFGSMKNEDYRWAKKIFLEIIDIEGNPIWTFPAEDILNDLLRTIKYKVSGAEDLISSLLSE